MEQKTGQGLLRRQVIQLTGVAKRPQLPLPDGFLQSGVPIATEQKTPSFIETDAQKAGG